MEICVVRELWEYDYCVEVCCELYMVLTHVCITSISNRQSR